MKRLSTLIIIILCGIVLAIPSFAASGRGHKNMGGGPCEGGRNMAAIADLNLSADQLVKFNDLKTTHLKDVKPLMDKMYILKGDLRLLWLEKNPDAVKISTVQKEIRSLRDQMEDKRTAHHLEVLKIMTPEQQTKFKALISREGFGPKHGMGHGQNPPSAGPCMMNQ